jgi:hypothetical protein
VPIAMLVISGTSEWTAGTTTTLHADPLSHYVESGRDRPAKWKVAPSRAKGTGNRGPIEPCSVDHGALLSTNTDSPSDLSAPRPTGHPAVAGQADRQATPLGRPSPSTDN